MNQDTIATIQIIVTAVSALAYVFTYRYMADKLKTMQQTVDTLKGTIDSQSKIISDFEKYKSLFDIDDFEKRLQFKLDNQKMELARVYASEAKGMVENAVNQFSAHVTKEYEKGLAGWEELISITVDVTLKKYPRQEQKQDRDEYINKYYPMNATFLIHFIDEIFAGKIQRGDQKK